MYNIILICRISTRQWLRKVVIMWRMNQHQLWRHMLLHSVEDLLVPVTTYSRLIKHSLWPLGKSFITPLSFHNCDYMYSMIDGRLLKPTHPVMSLDSTFLYRAFGSSGPDGQLWAAYTEVIYIYFILEGECTAL